MWRDPIYDTEGKDDRVSFSKQITIWEWDIVKSTFFFIYILVITDPFPLLSAQHMPLPHTCQLPFPLFLFFQLLSLFCLSYSPSWLNTSFHGHGGHFIDNSGRFNSHFMGKGEFISLARGWKWQMNGLDGVHVSYFGNFWEY